MEKRKERSAKVLAPVVQNVDKAIHWLNLYVVDNAILFPNTHPLDSDLSGGLRNPSFEQPEPGRREIISFSPLGDSLSQVPMGKKPLSPCVVKDQITFCNGFSGLIAGRRSSNTLTIFTSLNYYFK